MKAGFEMRKMTNRMAAVFTHFLRRESGATLVEYGVALLVVIIVGSAAISALGNAVGNEINETADAFSSSG